MTATESVDPTDHEIESPQWELNFAEPTTLEKGSLMVPGKIDTPKAQQFGALHSIAYDLERGQQYFEEALKLGTPNDRNVVARALLFSAAVAYARPFKTGVRPVRLSVEYFGRCGDAFDPTLHQYLVDIRDKHISHSVNEFEYCEPASVMVKHPGGSAFVAGVGIIHRFSIGISGKIAKAAVRQIAAMLLIVRADIEALRSELVVAERARLAAGGEWSMAPIKLAPSREKASERRR